MLPVQVIHLERSVEREQAFVVNNPGLDFEFFKAIDGRELNKADMAQTGLFEGDLPYTAGAYGLALTHLKLWEKAIASNQMQTIAEDDAIFRADFAEQAKRCISRLGNDWDLVLWAWNFDAVLSLNLMPEVSPMDMYTSQMQMRARIDTFKGQTQASQLLPLDKCFGTAAYTISPQGARRFKANCFPLKKFALYFPGLNRHLPNNGIDIAMNRIYKHTPTFVAMPPLAITPNDHAQSTIQNKEMLGA